MAITKTIPIVPNGKRYWVLPDKAEEAKVTVGGFTLEENGGKKKPPLQGRIIAVGDAMHEVTKPFTDGSKTTFHPVMASACKYRVDDLVIFGAYAGNIHTYDGVDYTVLHEDEILGHIVETPFDERDNTDLT